MKIKIIASAIFGFFIFFMLFKIYNGCKSVNKAFESVLPSSMVLAASDSALFNSNYLSRLKVIEVHKSKIREPISELLVDSLYYVVITSLKMKDALPLKKILNIQKASVSRTLGETYFIIDDRIYLSFQCRFEPVGQVSAIYLTANSSDTLYSKILNDSSVLCKSNCNNLSIRYSEKGPIDFYLEEKTNNLNSISMPLNVLFLQRNNIIYFITILPINHNQQIPADLILSIFNAAPAKSTI